MALNVAITGASGFLGSHLAEACSRQGHFVVGTTRRPQQPPPVPVDRWLAGSLDDVQQLTRAFEGVDVVIANAALAPGAAGASSEDFIRSNIQGIDVTLDAAARAGVRRIILISTVAVYQPKRGLRDEVDATRDPDRAIRDLSRLTTNPGYVRSKTKGEAIFLRRIHQMGLEGIVLRPGPLIGPRDHKLTARYCRWASRRWSLAPTAKLAHGYAPDVAKAAARAVLVAPTPNIYNVTGEAHRIVDIIRAFRDALRNKGRAHKNRIIPCPTPFTIDFDDRLAKRHLGFQTTPLAAIAQASVDDWDAN